MGKSTINSVNLIRFLYNNVESNDGTVQHADMLRRQTAGSFLRAAEAILKGDNETVVFAWLSSAESWMKDLGGCRKEGCAMKTYMLIDSNGQLVKRRSARTFTHAIVREYLNGKATSMSLCSSKAKAEVEFATQLRLSAKGRMPDLARHYLADTITSAGPTYGRLIVKEEA